MAVYDVQGKLVQTLVEGNLSAGSYQAEWSAKNNPSGIYFYRLETDGNVFSKRMMLVK